jgi:anti-anti-sigma factor
MAIAAPDQQHLTVPIRTTEIDIRTAEAFSDELAEAVDRASEVGAARLTLDLDGVTFIDSMGVGALLDARTRCGALDCRLDLTNAHRPVRLAFDVLGLLDTFGLH